MSVQKRHQLTNVVDAVPRLQPAPDLGMVNDHTRLDRAAYATVLFPLVALAVSTWLEGYHWTPLAAAGVALVLLGNVLVLMRRRPAAKESQPA